MGYQTNSDYEITVIRSKRKSLSVEVRSDCSVVVRAPKWVSKREIDSFIEERTDWIEETLSKMQKRIDDSPVHDKYSDRELEKIRKEAKEIIPPLVDEIANRMNVRYGRVTLRFQKTVWGSCTSKGNLNFNCLLILLPEQVMEYVIVHELCHLKYLNHSPSFWREVEKYCPDYKFLRDFLIDNGEKLMLRMK